VVAELFHSEGQTDGQREKDLTNLIVAFRNFANATKKKVNDMEPYFNLENTSKSYKTCCILELYQYIASNSSD
jgi:hypothetical protein